VPVHVIGTIRRQFKRCVSLVIVLGLVLLAASPDRVTAQAPSSTQGGNRANVVTLPDPIRTDDQKSWLDNGAAIAQVLAAVAALLGLPFIAAQLLYARHDSRMQTTAELLARWEAREFRTVQSRVTAFLAVEDAAQCVDKLLAWEGVAHSEAAELPRGTGPGTAPKPSQNDVDQIRNFFEDVAIRYNEGEIVREPVVSSIGHAAVREYVKALWLTHYERGGLSGTVYPLYREWEVMVEDLHEGPDLKPTFPWRRKPSSTTQEAIAYLAGLDTTPVVGLICLPGDDSAEARDLAKRLSLALQDSRLAEQLAAEAPSDQEDIPPTRWRVYFTPSALGLSDEEFAREWGIARSIALWLDSVSLSTIDERVTELEATS
jgi:hypothetical protein